MELLDGDLKDDDTLPTCDMTNCSLDDEWDDCSDDGNDHAVGNDKDLYATGDIQESKYETADIDKVVHSCAHLDLVQQNGLRAVLEKCPKLFDNELGT